ncbi:MAG: efflux RND transporter permease subunit [Candidatus Electrothrix sp. AUS4]|nr:efflux RND transporter permease subunit [Candidatus Electrothrix sp. AUS4]
MVCFFLKFSVKEYGLCLLFTRPIMLTSLTTFFGLAPMVFDQSVQARFLIPMAISLGYGIFFTTFVILVLICQHCI